MQESAWWQHGIVYEISSRSFQDSNDDGVGDLNGILQRLDYLVQLGIDAIWLSPIYPSPMADFGYDVADYCGIDPVFGTMEDFDRLLAEVHRRGLKMILDFVPNHTSDQHPWFLESRSSRENAKRDKGVLRYERRGDEDRILVLLNMSTDSVRMTTESGTILVSTDFERDRQRVNGTVEMKAAEGMVIDLDS